VPGTRRNFNALMHRSQTPTTSSAVSHRVVHPAAHQLGEPADAAFLTRPNRMSPERQGDRQDNVIMITIIVSIFI
jgi:hypothetical protein